MPRGIIAFGEVLSDPADMPYDSPYWINELAGDEPRVRVRYIVPPGLSLLEHALPELLDIAAARARGGTVFALAELEWTALLEATGGWPRVREDEIAEARATLAAIAEVGPQGGQSFVVSSARRKLIEGRAMAVARAHYENAGWIVEDVSATQSYDLHCVRNADEWRVLLTPNEVAHAQNRYPRVSLAVVANIAVDEEQALATAGDLSVYEPWDIQVGELTPLGFTYRVPT